MLRFLDKVIAVCTAYQNWYARTRWSRLNYPKCPFCGKRDKFVLIGGPVLVNYRYQMSRVRQRCRCTNCGMGLTLSRYAGSMSWSFTDV